MSRYFFSSVTAFLIAFSAFSFQAGSIFANNSGSQTTTPVEKTCGFQEQTGRTIVNFPIDQKIVSNRNEARAKESPVTATLSAGEYKVTLVSYDGYPDRVNTSQPHESWKARLLSSEGTVLATTNTSDDLADMVQEARSVTEVNTNFTVPVGVSAVEAYHGAYPDQSSPNSVIPVCAVFDKKAEVNNAPVITLLGGNQSTLTAGNTFTDPGATALDQEDGDITANIVVTGTVSTTTAGTYTLRYNVKDSKGLSAEEKTRTVVVMPRTSPLATIVASKIICDKESDLPNFGLGGPHVTSHTATDYVAAHSGCRLASDWSFQWGNQTVTDPGRNFVGEAENGWHTFGTTNASGTVAVEVNTLSSNTAKIWVREVLKEGYVSFTYDQQHKNNSDTKSAEMYCHTDVLNYDNYDFVSNPEGGETYYCVAWNVRSENATNTPPVITLLGNATSTVTVGNTFTDPGATALDQEDGDITANIIVTGTVSTTTAGTYTLRYNVKDSKGLSAEEKMRTVVVSEAPMCVLPQFTSSMSVHTTLGSFFSYSITATSTGTTTPTFTVATSSLPSGLLFSINTISGTTTVPGTFNIVLSTANMCGTASSTLSIVVDVDGSGGGGGSNPQCSDGADNDGDGKIDGADATCHSDGNPGNPSTYTPAKDNENAAPIITLLGENPVGLTTGNTFTDPGATAADEEDGNITPNIVVTGTVSTGVAGTYTLHYNVKDSKGLPAEEKTRTVRVSNPGGGGGGGGGCSGNCGGGGGGGAVLLLPSLRIYNETIERTTFPGIVLVRWQTNIPADSRVVFGTSSVTAPNSALVNYGYQQGTPTIPELTTTHIVAVIGFDAQNQSYFRPLSKQGSLSASGIELTLGQNAGECYYLREFIKFGANNNPVEVKKLQVFLNSFEGAKLEVTGFYDVTTMTATDAFQAKYNVDVLDPWGHDAPTGYVYLTTRKKVNEIYCRSAFPLNASQQQEVEVFRKFLESLKAHGLISSETNTEGGNAGNGFVLGATTTDETNLPEENVTALGTTTESTEVLPVTGRSAFRNLLGAAYSAVSHTVASYWLIILFAILLLAAGMLLKEFYRKEEEITPPDEGTL
jgi:hypothetical protein